MATWSIRISTDLQFLHAGSQEEKRRSSLVTVEESLLNLRFSQSGSQQKKKKKKEILIGQWGHMINKNSSKNSVFPYGIPGRKMSFSLVHVINNNLFSNFSSPTQNHRKRKIPIGQSGHVAKVTNGKSPVLCCQLSLGLCRDVLKCLAHYMAGFDIQSM